MSKLTTSLLLISIFRNILKDSIISSFIELLNNIKSNADINAILRTYSEFISLL
ncbi:TPA: hypothetical protein IAA87_03125, partial [Candidatus Avigastranaerophilus faecigallinarum]|nr:hypothetical protein [Candidatus Avigastranaerophilus faecigallinarum]